MDDDMIIERGGTQDDIDSYAERNGADLTSTPLPDENPNQTYSDKLDDELEQAMTPLQDEEVDIWASEEGKLLMQMVTELGYAKNIRGDDIYASQASVIAKYGHKLKSYTQRLETEARLDELENIDIIQTDHGAYGDIRSTVGGLLVPIEERIEHLKEKGKAL